MAYEVHLEVFDGPFDLLLQLITAQRVDLYEIRLADIVDGFLAEVARLEALDLELATEFLLIAATLIELKIRRLLPGSDEIDLDEELALFEARDYLLARLVECKTFSSAARALCELEAEAAKSLARRAGPDERFEGLAPDLLAGVRPEQLRLAAERALADKPAPPPVSVAHLHQDEVSVAATFEELRERLRDQPPTTFRELTATAPSRAHVVACFLALLELYKREIVELDQAGTFGELRVSWTGHEVADELLSMALASEFDAAPGTQPAEAAPPEEDAEPDVARRTGDDGDAALDAPAFAVGHPGEEGAAGDEEDEAFEARLAAASARLDAVVEQGLRLEAELEAAGVVPGGEGGDDQDEQPEDEQPEDEHHDQARPAAVPARTGAPDQAIRPPTDAGGTSSGDATAAAPLADGATTDPGANGAPRRAGEAQGTSAPWLGAPAGGGMAR
ncbi:MAG: segregation/condensation protein A [Actinomycetota bacterium]|nr:segregation/condensation protein A [Actinomycetota bacterium]